MEAVGDFICVRSDQAWLYIVDRTAESIKRDIFHLRKQLSKLLIDRHPEARIASEDIFIKSGLTFMKPHEIYLHNSSIFICRINILSENSVSALMDRAEHCRDRIILSEVICDADIS